MVHPAYFAIPLISLGIAAIYYLLKPAQRQNTSDQAGPSNNTELKSLLRKGAVRRRKIKVYNEEDECSICQDAECNVEIYPCRHREICEQCIQVIITKLDRLCPFCRQYITGFTNIKN